MAVYDAVKSSTILKLLLPSLSSTNQYDIWQKCPYKTNLIHPPVTDIQTNIEERAKPSGRKLQCPPCVLKKIWCPPSSPQIIAGISQFCGCICKVWKHWGGQSKPTTAHNFYPSLEKDTTKLSSEAPFSFYPLIYT